MPTVRLALHAMATRFELVLFDEYQSEQQLRAAGEAALEEITELDRLLSRFRADSLVSHINRTAAAHPVRLTADLFEMFVIAAQVHEQSSGAFDITVAPLMDALGFQAVDSGTSQSDEMAIGADAVLLDDASQTIRFTHSGVTIDLGGIAKGYALDYACEILREAGIRTALIHGGTSTVIALGAPPHDDAGWGIQLHDPQLANAQDVSPQPIVHLIDAALSVSTAHGRVATTENGARVSHILDPRTQSSVPETQRFAVAIRALEREVESGEAAATYADAWSTALLVLGERPPDLAETITTIQRTDAAGEELSPYTVRGSLSSVFELRAKSANLDD